MVLFAWACSSASIVEEHAMGPYNSLLYDELASTMAELFDELIAVKTKHGIDFRHKETFRNSKGAVEPIVHMHVEGPLEVAGIGSLEEAIAFTAHAIRDEVDSSFNASNQYYPGLRVTTVNINNMRDVGVLTYKMSHEPDTHCSRAVIYTDNGVYSFNTTIHQYDPSKRMKMYGSGLVVTAVLSGKL